MWWLVANNWIVLCPRCRRNFEDRTPGARPRPALGAAVGRHQVQPLTEACQQQGLLVTPTRGGVIRLLPALLVSESEIDAAMTKLAAALCLCAPGNIR